MLLNYSIGYILHQKPLYISYPCNDSTHCDPISLDVSKGTYLFELWGARSGNDIYSSGFAYGAYVKGTLKLHKNTKFQVHLGGVGVDGNSGVSCEGGNNGGAWGASAGGGGATDVRLDDSLSSRIIVAAGAGSGERISDGHGGGLVGITGTSTNCTSNSLHFLNTSSTGGTQDSGGLPGSHYVFGSANAGGFGYGGSGRAPRINGIYDGGPGGGGGYFGGGGVPFVCSASGGSSYISGHPGCKSVPGPESNITTDNVIHYSGLFFTDTKMIPGFQIMPLPGEEQREGKGNTGPGAIRITVIRYGNESKSYNHYYFIKKSLLLLIAVSIHPVENIITSK